MPVCEKLVSKLIQLEHCSEVLYPITTVKLCGLNVCFSCGYASTASTRVVRHLHDSHIV